MDITSKKIP